MGLSPLTELGMSGVSPRWARHGTEMLRVNVAAAHIDRVTLTTLRNVRIAEIDACEFLLLYHQPELLRISTSTRYNFTYLILLLHTIECCTGLL